MTTSTTGQPTGRAVMETARRVRFGFLSQGELSVLARDPETRLTLVLVRCGGGRFLTPAQNADHFIALVERDGREYVRDISLPAEDPADQGW